MTFYSDPAFFIFAAIFAIPAIICGLLGRSLKAYGLIVSVVFLILLFGGDVRGALALVGFLALATALTLWVQRLFGARPSPRRRTTDEASAVGEANAASATGDQRSAPHPHAVAWYRVALALIIVPLAAAKVAEVFDSNLLGFIGMSYITFKAIQVLIEVRDGLIKDMRIVDYWYFLLFFPVFTSGPITRSRDFIAQANAPLSHSEYASLLASGVLWLFKGALYTFLLAALFQWLLWFVPSAIGTASGLAQAGSAVCEAFFYGLYLFFDFAGYSFMAMGLGACLGIRVPTNFRAPFRSIDIKDFWNRWHITLSFWLRDYVFMRLSKAFIKRKVFASRTTTACVGFISEMALMGAWHGLTISCIAYGVYHGALLALCEVYQKKSKFYKKHKKKRWYKIGSWAITMVAVFFGFALFSNQVYEGFFGGVQ